MMDSVAVFPAAELVEQSHNESRYVIVTEGNILNFEMIDKKKNLLKLLGYANIQSLLNIKRKKDEESAIILSWKDSQKKDGNVQVLFMDEATKFIEVVVKNMKNFGIKVLKNVVKKPDLAPEDVTTEALQRVNIEKILQEIELYEKKVADKEVTIETVNSLMSSYQKVPGRPQHHLSMSLGD